MQNSKKTTSWFKWASGVIAAMYAVMANADVLITLNNDARGSVSASIDTYQAGCGGAASQVNSFVPDGGKCLQQGRGLAINGAQIFYTELDSYLGTSRAIHIAPYGIDGSGGGDIGELPNPRPGTGIQALSYAGGALYALTGYFLQAPAVYKLNPATGAILAGPIFISGPGDDCDGFAVLPDGNFLINGGDMSTVYKEYSHTTGTEVPNGLTIDLSSACLGSHGSSTGVTVGPDGQSLYFLTDMYNRPQTVVRTDLSGSLLSSRALTSSFDGENIAVSGGPDPALPTIETFAGKTGGLVAPIGLFYDSRNGGHLFIADLGAATIKYVQSDGSVINLFNQNATFNFSSPMGVALDANGYLYVADADYGGILDFQNWGQTPVQLGYPADWGSPFTTFTPQSLAMDSSGNLYFVDESRTSFNGVNYTTTYNWVGEVVVGGTYGNPTGSFSDVAGTGTQGAGPVGGSPLSCGLYVDDYITPGKGLLTGTAAVDSQGNVFIADIGNNVVLEVSGGSISVVAGNYTGGYSGDGGPAVNAELLHPAAVAVDATGNIYIADSGNHIIRKVDTCGIMTTVVGTPQQSGYSGDDAPARSATLNSPSGLTFDPSGNLYISDMGNSVIRKVSFTCVPEPACATVSAGTLTSSSFTVNCSAAPNSTWTIYESSDEVNWGSPHSITMGGDGTYAFVDNLVSGIASRYYRLGNGTCFSDPTGFTRSIITTYAGQSGGLAAPIGLYFDARNGANNLYVADLNGPDIVKVAPNGGMSVVQLDGNNFYFSSPVGVAIDANGYLYVADADWGGILDFQNWNQAPFRLGVPTDLSSPYTTFTPQSLAIDSSGNLYFVEESQTHFDGVNTTTTYDWVGEVAPGGTYLNPTATFSDVAGNGTQGYPSSSLYVDDYIFTGNGTLMGTAAVDNQGNIYIADIGNNAVEKVNVGSETILTVAGGNGAGYSGDNGLATRAQLNNPGAVAVDPAGNIYIADSGNHIIRKVDTCGFITLVAGTPQQSGYTGDNQSPTSATLNSPSGLTFDPSGNLYISDMGNSVIRKIAFH